jgi:hypothetical protein
MRIVYKTPNHRIAAYVTIDARGVHTISDEHHRLLGRYDPRTNRTSDRHHRLVGYGCLIAKLVPGLTEDSGVIKPKPPRTPEQSRRDNQRRAEAQRQIGDERDRHAEKMRGLRDKVSGR